ncbi:MAG: DUF6907 domain-containing protein [Pseudonocardia sp.]
MSNPTSTAPPDGQCPRWCTTCTAGSAPGTGEHVGQMVELPFTTAESHVVRVHLDQGADDDSPMIAAWLDLGEDTMRIPPVVARELAAALVAAADLADGVAR